MIENAIFGGGDKLNALSAVLVYVYRVKSNELELNEDMINKFINSIRSNNIEVNNIKTLILGMMNGEIDKNTLLDAITLNLDKDSIYTSRLKQLIKADMSSSEINDYIKTTTPMIIDSTKINAGFAAISRASYRANTTQLDDLGRKRILEELTEELASLYEDNNDDEDVMESIDVSAGGILNNLEKAQNGDKIDLVTGWEELNIGLSGYLSTGEFVAIEAQQHKNKTGFTMSIFLQTILNNRVVDKDGKKPTWIWISLEDSVDQIIVKMFIYLYFRKYKRMPNEEELNNHKFIDKFFKEEIAATGHELLLYRINPDKFSFERFKTMVRRLESQGRKIICTSVDYLEKAYTDGNLYNTGTIGSGLKNMTTKFRTYIQEHNILFITPAQVSSEANNLLRSGILEKDFVKVIVNRGFHQGSRGLIQEWDLQLLIHLCRINGQDYQAVQVGKLKRPAAPDPKDKYMLIPFEKPVKVGKVRLLGPLMEDISATDVIIKDDDDSDDGIDL